MDGRPALRALVMGPLRVLDAEGVDRTPVGELQRRLMALLLLRRGQVVTADEAVGALWPRGLPRDPAAALQTHVFRLRKSLPAGTLTSSAAGYCLAPPPSR
jgi:DNA-binding SARP family transcriptional activator